MIGLETHRRDAGLPARAGDAGLAPPSEALLLELVREHLCAPGADAPRAAHWVYARWKPGTALLTAYRLEYADGEERTVSLKCHAGDKARALAGRAPAELPADVRDDRLRPMAVIPRSGAYLSAFPFDRELPGLGRALDLRRTSRTLAALGLFSPLRVRPGPSRVEALRYKPERRAVLALDLRLRPPGHGPRTAARLLARVLPPDVAAHVALRRRAFEASAVRAGRAGGPAIVGCEERTGLVFEEWLDLVADGSGASAELSGAALARLHGVPVTAEAAALAGPGGALAVHDELFAIDARLRALAGAVQARSIESASPSVWAHGDFHAGQVALDADGATRLLDLDGLAPGDAAQDLADWVADAMTRAPEPARRAALSTVCAALLSGYERGGGGAPDAARLRGAIARSLLARAAGCLRRLEDGAVERAHGLLELAAELADGGGAP